MTKITVSGYYGFDNFGDETILFVLLNYLKSKKFDITVFSKNPETTSKKYGIKSLNTFSFFDVVNQIRKTDFLISGGGSLLQDATSAKSLIYYLFVLFLAWFFKKKIVIFAQGIGPINSFILRKFTKFILHKADFISVRDDKSLFLLRSWGLKPLLVNDPVWGLEVKTAQERKYLGIQLRSWKDLSDSFLKELAKLAIEKAPPEGIKLFAFQNFADLPICGKFRNYILEKNPLINVEIIQNQSIEQIVYELSTCKNLIAMRYHALLLGLKLGISSFALCYDIKVQNLAEEHKVPYCLINDVSQLNEHLKDMYGNNCLSINKTFSFDEMDAIFGE